MNPAHHPRIERSRRRCAARPRQHEPACDLISLQVLVLATSNAQLPPPAGPREDLIEAATTPLLFMALYSLVPALPGRPIFNDGESRRFALLE
jgi:hypothetical protein